MQSLSDWASVVRPASTAQSEKSTWQAALRLAFRDPAELRAHLGLPRQVSTREIEAAFPLLAPRPFVDRMRHGDPNDPLLLQVLPAAIETYDSLAPNDAVGDLAAGRAPGLIQKYDGRALMMLSSNCAINCRYCFRRHYPYESVPRSDQEWAEAIALLENDTSITELILSGGDPLMLGDNKLAKLFARLSDLPHITRIRIHTRLPVVIPTRVTTELCDLIERSRFRVIVVLHTNHANEVDKTVANAAKALQSAGSMLLNQSVLLRRVNDSAEALSALSERLLEIGVLPYYLHLLDVVPGVRHHEVPESHGIRLVADLRRRLPGYAVPRLVREQPGQPHKTLIA